MSRIRKVTFYATCGFAGCDMDEITEELDLDKVNLDDEAAERAIEWASVEGWYEEHDE